MACYPELLLQANKYLDEKDATILKLQEELKEVHRYPTDKVLEEQISGLEAEVCALEKKICKASTRKSLSSESVESVKNMAASITKETDKRLKIVSYLLFS